jgi:hypothetical protein
MGGAAELLSCANAGSTRAADAEIAGTETMA